ncbi:hypothetical protein M8542_10305 [Amycolatopsis sp. OK19-0408]|uniref:Uncharacterized protein n=1 Tax=Amycolatopsis iheyensis TaxID=2945988 RepID=A0A9X2N947_9PSEU|nr:hypothetical protein [Amycolatopsis iheyensis]MCR6483208.1 hypothetical protein [Amycolatopsis iheyensis]
MTSFNRPARLNRFLLGLFGLALLAAGAFAVATHFGLLRLVDPDAPLVPGTDLPPTWVRYAAAPTLVLVVTVGQDGDPAAIRERLDTQGLPRLREALEEIPVRVEFRFSAATAPPARWRPPRSGLR